MYSVCKWTAELEEGANCKMWSGITIHGKIMTRMVSISASCACKNKSFLPCSRMSKSLKKVRHEMWFDGENHSSMSNIHGTPF